ncbi:SPP1 family predicted phage head-tail adaptor [Paraburkholderia sp. WSM4175]|uniref:phage head closure protein n=1 Tax=Paraburkholderia sp. WSM4175 TaxID=2991072 RepID=UPI003D1EB27F
MRKTTGIRAGPLIHRVRIEAPVVGMDNSNAPAVKAWREVATVYAAIESLSGREWLASSEFRSDVTTRIRIRWREDIDASMRVLHHATIYRIDAVLPQHQGRSEVFLLCSTGAVTEGGQP